MVYVIVEDDGVGFDIDAISKDGIEHVGIHNVETRIRSMCGGRMEIDSKVGRGTKVMIELPQ